MKSAVRRGFVCAAIAWAIMLPLAALAASRTQVSAMVSVCAIAVYGIGSFICHQLPERSFHLWSAQLPVCARCTGIYFGAAIAAAVIQLRGGGACSALAERCRRGPGTLGPCTVRALIVALTIPSLATLVYEWTTGDTPSNPIRFAAGLPLGAVVSWLVLRVN